MWPFEKSDRKKYKEEEQAIDANEEMELWYLEREYSFADKYDRQYAYLIDQCDSWMNRSMDLLNRKTYRKFYILRSYLYKRRERKRKRDEKNYEIEKAKVKEKYNNERKKLRKKYDR